MGNGNSDTVGIRVPEWVTGAAKQYGLVGLIVLVLLGAVLGFYETPMTNKLDAHIKETERHQRIQIQTSWYNQRILEQICIRLSTTTKERSDCLPIPSLNQNGNHR